jgi:hypothetical protein
MGTRERMRLIETMERRWENVCFVFETSGDTTSRLRALQTAFTVFGPYGDKAFCDEIGYPEGVANDSEVRTKFRAHKLEWDQVAEKEMWRRFEALSFMIRRQKLGVTDQYRQGSA